MGLKIFFQTFSPSGKIIVINTVGHCLLNITDEAHMVAKYNSTITIILNGQMWLRSRFCAMYK